MIRAIGHHAPRFLALLLGSVIVLSLVPAASSLAIWPILAAVFAVALFLGISILAHNRRLCERCVSSVPLDASRAASRAAVRFRIAHLFESRVFALCYLTSVLGASLLYSHPVGRYGWAAAELSLVYLLLVYVTHQRLQPWCPHCRTGGEEQSTPTAPRPLSTPA